MCIRDSFTSLRQDSGDPLAFVDKVIRRYEELRIDPRLKYIVFSDSLNVERAIQIKNYCGGRIGATFGIGTNLTNDVGNNIKGMNLSLIHISPKFGIERQSRFTAGKIQVFADVKNAKIQQIRFYGTFFGNNSDLSEVENLLVGVRYTPCLLYTSRCV